jgi:hypothetical protein
MRQQLAENPGEVFAGILSREDVDEGCRALGHVWRKRVFTPLVTLWTFLTQALSADACCRQAVARVLGFLSATGGLTASHDASAYCRARKRLPAKLLPRLTRLVAGRLAARVEPKHLWHGHRVKLVDGSSVAMPDTPENQAVYPQPQAQKPGCGFPVARVTAIFDLLTGALVDLALGALAVGETLLFHRIWGSLDAGDVAVADRHFCSYADIALLRAQGVESVFRLHPGRVHGFREGQYLSHNERLVRWTKHQRPAWLSPEEFEALPDTQVLRLVRFRCRVPGWRVDEVFVVTTLLDPKAYPASEIAELFHRRWDIETDFAHLKTTMQMEFLRTRTPDMVERELWAHLLAYNLIRSLMWEAGLRRRVAPTSLSFKATIQETMALWPFTAAAARRRDLTGFYDTLLHGIGFHRLPQRPNRSEPRVRKRRPKCYPLMVKPRQLYRKELRRRRA